MERTSEVDYAGCLIVVAPDSEGGGGIGAAYWDLRSRLNRQAGDNYEHESREASWSIRHKDICSHETRELIYQSHIEGGRNL